MNILPEGNGFKTAGASVVAALGVGGTIIAGLLLLALLVFGAAGIGDWWESRKATQAVESLRNEADALKIEAEAAKAEAATARDESLKYQGAAAAYKEQAEEILEQRRITINERPKLQQNSATTARKVEQVRRQPIKPIDGNIGKRVDDFVSTLDKLVPDDK